MKQRTQEPTCTKGSGLPLLSSTVSDIPAIYRAVTCKSHAAGHAAAYLEQGKSTSNPGNDLASPEKLESNLSIWDPPLIQKLLKGNWQIVPWPEKVIISEKTQHEPIDAWVYQFVEINTKDSQHSNTWKEGLHGRVATEPFHRRPVCPTNSVNMHETVHLNASHTWPFIN